jgi:hypothetical protein
VSHVAEGRSVNEPLLPERYWNVTWSTPLPPSEEVAARATALPPTVALADGCVNVPVGLVLSTAIVFVSEAVRPPPSVAVARTS